MMILIAHFFRLLFALISSPQANDHAIPSPTTASTPRRRTILMTNRISFAKTDWNPASHVGTVHSYFLFSTGPLQLTHDSPFCIHHPSCSASIWLCWLPGVVLYWLAVFQLSDIHLQSAPGTASEVNIFIGPDDDVLELVDDAGSAACIGPLHSPAVSPVQSAANQVFTSPDDIIVRMSTSIFCIFFRVGMWRYLSWSWDQQGGWWEQYPYWGVWIFIFSPAPHLLLMWWRDRLPRSAWI